MTVCHRDFASALLDSRKPVPAGLTFRSEKANKRFAVYRNNVAVSLTDALQSLFPVVRKLVGDEFFKAMAGVYLRRHPPASPLLAEFGIHMPAFLAGFEPVARLPYLPDVAKLEILIRESFHSKDSVPISNAYLASLEPEELLRARLGIAPSARLLRSRYPAFGIWHANAAGGSQPKNRPENVLVARREFDPKPWHLPGGAYEFIDSLAKGSCISEAADQAAAMQSEFRLDQALAILLKSGAAIEIKSQFD